MIRMLTIRVLLQGSICGTIRDSVHRAGLSHSHRTSLIHDQSAQDSCETSRRSAAQDDSGRVSPIKEIRLRHCGSRFEFQQLIDG